MQLRQSVRASSRGFELIVSDSGPGVPKELREKIWQPLFTTRKDKQGRETGTGLGLTIVRSIVDELDGSVSVGADAMLGGARFTVWMPMR